MTVYFPPDAWDWAAFDAIVRTLPSPLAVTYRQLKEAVEDQEPAWATFKIKDAFECLIKFVATIAVADCIAAGPDGRPPAEICARILKRGGLSIGDWDRLLRIALQPLQPLARTNELEQSERCFPGLFLLFFDSRGKPSRLSSYIGGGAPGGFITWRNKIFPTHAPSRDDRMFYAETVREWLPQLHELYREVAAVLTGWDLVAETPAGRIRYRGEADVEDAAVRRNQVPEQVVLRAVLVSSNGSAQRRLDLNPLLSMERCLKCGEPHLWFFDRNDFERQRHTTILQEYFRGHPPQFRKDWEETLKLADRLPPGWERTSYDVEEVEDRDRLAFRHFVQEYVGTRYLFQAIESIADRQSRGYVCLRGPAGAGKTFLVRGATLPRQRGGAGWTVLAYHIFPGSLGDYRTFVSVLSHRAHSLLRRGTQEIQTRNADVEELRAELVRYLRELREDNHLYRLWLAIDGLDELPDPAGQRSIVDLLPAGEALPDGCFVLLTGRADLPPGVQLQLDRVAADPVFFQALDLDPANTAYREVLRTYIRSRVPERFRGPADVDAVVERSEGLFLFAYYQCQLLSSGMVTDVQALPPVDRLYSASLERLREQTGLRLYEECLPGLLFPAAARRAVSLTQLERWGVKPETLPFLAGLIDGAEPDSADLAGAGPTPVYRLANQFVAQHLVEDAQLAERLRDAHATIGQVALRTWQDRWDQIDPMNEDEAYDLAFADWHLEQAGLADEALELQPMLAQARWSAAQRLDPLAFEGLEVDVALARKVSLLESAFAGYRDLARSSRTEALVSPMAEVLGELVGYNRFYLEPETLVEYHLEALAIIGQLIEENRLDGLAKHLHPLTAMLGQLWQHDARPPEPPVAIRHWDDAIRICRRLVTNGRDDLVGSLAGLMLDRGALAQELGEQNDGLIDGRGAADLLAEAVAGGRRDLLPQLIETTARLVRAVALSEPGPEIEESAAPSLRVIGRTLAAEGRALGDMAGGPELFESLCELDAGTLHRLYQALGDDADLIRLTPRSD